MIHLGSSNKMLEIKSGSVQLIFESPPYEKQVACCQDKECLSSYQGEAYAEESKKFLPERLRILADHGSYILNFQAQVINGILSPTVYLLPKIIVEAGFVLIDTHIWHKPNATPFAPEKRLKPAYEFLFQFSKSKDYLFNKDAIREPSLWAEKDHRKEKYNPLGKDPGNVILDENFFTSRKSQDQASLGHPAKMAEGIASRFIKLLTNPRDTVLDGFCGTGQTGIESLALGRKFIGYELHQDRVSQARERLGEDKKEVAVMNKVWMNSDEVAEYTGLAFPTIRSKTSKGQIPVHKIGRVPRYHKEEIDRWILNDGNMAGLNLQQPPATSALTLATLSAKMDG